MSIPLPPGDPAQWMLSRGRAEDWAVATGQLDESERTWVTKTHPEIYKSTCYICIDEEFALMGMPVCKPCPMCGVHWAADDGECDNGCDIEGYYIDNNLGLYADEAPTV